VDPVGGVSRIAREKAEAKASLICSQPHRHVETASRHLMMPHGDSYLALTARVPRPRRGVTGEPAFLDNVLHHEVLGKHCVHLSNMPRRRLVHRRSNEQHLEHHRKAGKPERGTLHRFGRNCSYPALGGLVRWFCFFWSVSWLK
jgi:hypothetical protein